MDVIPTIESALKADPDVRLAVLFGSAARGTPTRKSDVDVAVLGVPMSRLSPLAASLSRAVGCQVDLIPLETAPPLLRVEIARDGLLLLERAADMWSHFRARAMVDWWDWAPLARRFSAAAVARLDATSR